MLRSEAVTAIKRGLGFRQTQDTTIIAALQAQQRMLERGKTLPSWLLTFDVPFTITANSNAITMPARFLRFHDDFEMYYTNASGARVFLPRKQYTEAYQAYVASGDADDSAVIPSPPNTYPSVFVQYNKTTGIVVPTPTVSFTAYATCYVGAAVLDSDAENAWLANAPDYLIGLAGIQVAGALRDKDALAAFSLMAKQGISAYLGDVVEDELAGRPLVMGRNN
jgi:hypothetical protein